MRLVRTKRVAWSRTVVMVMMVGLLTGAAAWISPPLVAAAPEPVDTEEIGRYVVAFERTADADLGRSVSDGGEPTGDDPQWAVVELDAAELADLRSDPAVAHLEPDHRYRPAGVVTQDDPPWGLDRIDQRDPALSGTYTPRTAGAGVTVYVVDDGIHADHPDFGGRVVSGWSGAADGASSGACSAHGTHVAGTVGGAGSGVAKQVTLVPVRVFGCDGSSSLSTLLAGLDWVMDHHRAGRPAVVNMSIEGPRSEILAEHVATMVARGLVVVVAAGNGSRSACDTSPAHAATAITVAATDRTDRRPGFSNFGSCVDLFAPGTDISSAGFPTGTAVRTGTSMAVPHVTGAAALLLAAEPSLTPAAVIARLRADATTGAVRDPGPGSPDLLLHVPPMATASPAPEVTSSLSPPGHGFVGVAPERLLDTRAAGKVAAGSVSMVSIDGAAGTAGVVLNVTVVDPVATGYVSVFPCGVPMEHEPVSSNVNFTAGRTVANAVVSPVADGGVCVYTSTETHLLVDLTGAFTAGFSGQTPQRMADTRATVPLVAGQTLPVATGVPGAATGVVLNVTVVDPAADGYVSVFPCAGSPEVAPPASSNINFTTGATVANAVVSSVGAAGHVCVHSSAAAHVLVDVGGSLTSGFSGRLPERVTDTRATGRVGAGTVTPIRVAGTADLTVGAVLNVTVVDPVDDGYVSVVPCSSWTGSAPTSSSVNFNAGTTVANAVVTTVDGDGEVCVYSSADTHLLIDLAGTVR